ncbi:GspH/FimT family pseudopilin [Agarivorans sp. Z349TD_8]|uniref:GspH/FimT family pseudopilin n=1 Tax=Agarivorans sp. Z349TD_8 TaxID=3421434 RepID=UPI003D7DC7E4
MPSISKRTLRHRGFTLIELLIAVAILMIIMVVAVPSMQSFIEDSKQRVTRDLLASSLNVAQQEAIRNNLSTYVCPTSSGTSCASAWGGNTGWLVYLDEHRDGSLSDANQIIVSYPSPKSAKLQYTPTSSNSVLLRFFPSGHALAGIFTICSPSAAFEDQRIELTRMGRIEYASPSTSYCP